MGLEDWMREHAWPGPPEPMKDLTPRVMARISRDSGLLPRFNHGVGVKARSGLRFWWGTPANWSASDFAACFLLAGSVHMVLGLGLIIGLRDVIVQGPVGIWIHWISPFLIFLAAWLSFFGALMWEGNPFAYRLARVGVIGYLWVAVMSGLYMLLKYGFSPQVLPPVSLAACGLLTGSFLYQALSAGLDRIHSSG